MMAKTHITCIPISRDISAQPRAGAGRQLQHPPGNGFWGFWLVGESGNEVPYINPVYIYIYIYVCVCVYLHIPFIRDYRGYLIAHSLLRTRGV